MNHLGFKLLSSDMNLHPPDTPPLNHKGGCQDLKAITSWEILKNASTNNKKTTCCLKFFGCMPPPLFNDNQI